MLALGGAVIAIPKPLGSQTKQRPRAPIDQQDKQSVLNSEANCHDPVYVCSGRGGILSVTLEVKYAHHFLGDDKVWIRTYNGSFPGPTIRVRPGDKLRVKLTNTLPPEGEVEHKPNLPGRLNWTNLHTHGLHVSPVAPSDDVYLSVGPGSEYQYEFQIPANHPCGTFWYHAHHHGSVALQLSSGMAGALIVEGQGLDEVPQIKGIRDKVLLFQRVTYRMNAQGVGEVLADDIYGDEPAPGLRAATTINGVIAPNLYMAPGEVQRWRLLHAGLQTTGALGLVNASDHSKLIKLHEIAVDGLATGTIRAQDVITLQPGNRSDVLVKAPAEPGIYLLINNPVAALDSVSNKDQPLRYLAKVIVQGRNVDMPLPTAEALKACRPFAHIKASEVTARQTLTFFYKGGKATINEAIFDLHQERPQPKLGSVEEWTLVSAAGLHPFHIHVNPFEVIEVDPVTGEEQGTWRDIVGVKNKSKVVIRMRFTDFVGKSVMHCHNLMHEDLGMMMGFEIIGPDGPMKAARLGLGTLPVKAPAWSLPDAAGATHRLADFAGKPLVVVFFQGTACKHCLQQLQAIAKERQAFADAGIAVVAICPETREDLKEALKHKSAPALTILSDRDLKAFQEFGCFDKQPLHGTFVIDPAGQVRWQNVGEQPFMDVDTILREAKRQAKGPR
jgi:FtsP/CotA-like multicopper oxidase with cupredoxin domain/peroxiredoxin